MAIATGKGGSSLLGSMTNIVTKIEVFKVPTKELGKRDKQLGRGVLVYYAIEEM